MSAFREMSFGDQAIAKLSAMPKDEFARKLHERCPELFKGAGEKPAGAVVPEFTSERTVSTAVSEIAQLATVVHKATQAFGQLTKQVKAVRPGMKPATPGPATPTRGTTKQSAAAARPGKSKKPGRRRRRAR
jgi:hypothetical protein